MAFQVKKLKDSFTMKALHRFEALILPQAEPTSPVSSVRILADGLSIEQTAGTCGCGNAGMYVRVHGDQLIAELNRAPWQHPEDGYRVRFTRLGANCYGLSVKRNTGRCSKNPFPRNTRAHSDAVRAVMQHLVANY